MNITLVDDDNGVEDDYFPLKTAIACRQEMHKKCTQWSMVSMDRELIMNVTMVDDDGNGDGSYNDKYVVMVALKTIDY